MPRPSHLQLSLKLALLLALAPTARSAEAAAASAAVQAHPVPSCVVTVGARTFDLGELGGSGSALAFTSHEEGSRGWIYSFSACGDVSPPLTCGAAAPRSAVLQQTDNACYGLGAFSTRSLAATPTGVTVSFSGGDLCGAGDTPRSTTIAIQCADLALPQIVLVGHGATHCSYSALVRSRAGCATECARNASGAVCSGASRGQCVTVDAARLSRCVCSGGYTGASCADAARNSDEVKISAAASLLNTLASKLVLFVSCCLFCLLWAPACSAVQRTVRQRRAASALLLFCSVAFISAWVAVSPTTPLAPPKLKTLSHASSFGAKNGLANGFVDGCANVYLDFGSNIGIQVRKLFEPELFSGAPVLPFFDKHLGAADDRRRETCAIGFEINPALTARLQELQAAYVAQGWRTHFFTETGIGFNDTTLLFSPDGDAAHFWWSSRLVQDQGSRGGVRIPVKSIAQVVRSILQRRLPDSLQREKPRIAVKLDVEGRELELMQLLHSESLLCNISFVYVELHDTTSRNALPAFMRALGCGTEIFALDDETGFDRQLPLPAL